MFENWICRVSLGELLGSGDNNYKQKIDIDCLIKLSYES